MLAIMLMIAQVLGVPVAAAKPSAFAAGKTTVVICSVHGYISLEIDDASGQPAKHSADPDCPFCRAGGVAVAAPPPLKDTIAYELLLRPAEPKPLHLAVEVPAKANAPGQPASPRGPPSRA